MLHTLFRDVCFSELLKYIYLPFFSSGLEGFDNKETLLGSGGGGLSTPLFELTICSTGE